MTSPLRVTIDTPVAYRLAIDPDAELLMRDAVKSGRLVLVAPHLLRDTVERVPREERERLVTFVADLTLQTKTAGLILDLTRWDESALPGDTQASAPEAAQILSPHHSAGALILATAQCEGMPFVTDDQGLLRRACLDLGVPVMTSRELIARVKLL